MTNMIETEKYKMIPLIVEVPPIETNCYVLIDKATNQALVVDPGSSAPFIKQTVDEQGAKIVKIVNTHAHWDHVSGNVELMALTGAELLINEKELFILKDSYNNCAMSFGFKGNGGEPSAFLNDGDVLELGELKLDVLLTPGHTPGSISLVCEDLLFCGDVLFQLSMGRTDLPYGNEASIMASLRRLASLPGNKVVCSGHGPLSDLDFERKYNPFIRMSGYRG